MTQEEKAKAYDEALEKAKAHINNKGIGDTVDLCKHLFPELRESEDERIIEEIKFAVMQMPTERQDTKERCIAYLEKQKSKDDEEKYLDSIKRDWFERGKKEVLTVPELYGLEKQKEQKPVEWSKNDTVFLNEITDFFENKTVKLQHDLDMYAHWLKSLPERFNLQPKPAEWSEEDENYLGVIIRLVEQVSGWPERAITEYTNWLKSLRGPKSSDNWKPSEEQMSAFKGYIEDFQARAEAAVGGWNNFDVMIRLYEQLKKL